MPYKNIQTPSSTLIYTHRCFIDMTEIEIANEALGNIIREMKELHDGYVRMEIRDKKFFIIALKKLQKAGVSIYFKRKDNYVKASDQDLEDYYEGRRN